MKIMMTAGAGLLAAALASGAAQAATTYASEIYAKRSGEGATYANSQVSNTNRGDAGNALGSPDQVGDTEGGFYSLGLGGVAIFGFGTDFYQNANVFEVTFSCAGGGASGTGLCSTFPESADLWAFNGALDLSDTGADLSDLMALGFTQIGTIPNGTANGDGGVSLMIGGPFTYLALIDNAIDADGDGFDVDAVSVTAVPLPASIVFLLAGIGGLGFLRGRRSATA